MNLNKLHNELNMSEEAIKLRRDVKQIVGKPPRYKSQGKKIKRALFWGGKKPTHKAPKGFITNVPQKNIDKSKSIDDQIKDLMRKFTT